MDREAIKIRYARFKAFVFLTLLVFAAVGLIAYLQGPPSPAPDALRTPEKPQPAATGEIPANWREDLGVPVLCYHQIVTEKQYRERPTRYAVTVSQFREQMRWLAENKFYTILPDEVLAYVKGEKKLDFKNGRPMMLTFDDGNSDFVRYAREILDTYKFKGVLFIYPTYIMARKKRALRWSEIKDVAKGGHAIESHTMWHPMLSAMSADEQRAQFADSKRLLDEKGGARVRHLAYPFGVYTDKSPQLLREVGYVSAYTTFFGANQVGEDPYRLRRYLVIKSDDAAVFAEKTLARSLPLRMIGVEDGAILAGPQRLEFKAPAGLKADAFQVKVFSTPQTFSYDAQSGKITVNFKPAKKRLSVLEILYKEKDIEYRATALFNHKRRATADQPREEKRKKGKKRG